MRKLYKYNPNHYCAIYARRSTSNDKDNIENQLQTCRDKAHELNLIISEEYFDYESATKFEPLHRPGFKKLIYDLKNNKFKTLVVYKRDRLARKVLHFKEIKYLCKQNNVKIIYSSADEAFLSEENTDKNIFPLIENILISFAELEPENIARRTKDGRDRKRASGNYSISARCPKGYIKEGKGKNAKLVPDAELSPIIREVFEKLSNISLTKKSIKSILNEINNKYNINLKDNDILKSLGELKRGQILVGFAAESNDLLENATLKLKNKNLDYIVANDIISKETGFGSDENKVTILSKKGEVISLDKMSKRRVAREIFNTIIKDL